MVNKIKDPNLTPSVDLPKLGRLRRRHLLFFSVTGLALLVWIGGGLLSFLLPGQFGNITWRLSLIGLAILAASLALSYPLGRTPCPRCGKPFYTSEGTKGFLQKINCLTRHCVHCGQSMSLDTKTDQRSP